LSDAIPLDFLLGKKKKKKEKKEPWPLQLAVYFVRRVDDLSALALVFHHTDTHI